MKNCSEVEHSIVVKYRRSLYAKFIRAIQQFQLIEDGDKIGVCISGGKDSFLLAKLFDQLSKQKNFSFSVEYIVMNPGYQPQTMQKIQENLQHLQISASIIQTDIFQASSEKDCNPCFYCAKYRRSALLRIAQQLGCNKIALGHHYDDVIETTLMNMLNVGSFKTMLPKHQTDSDLAVIRPMYFIREKDVQKWVRENQLSFIECACHFTRNKNFHSKRAETKLLIQQLKSYNENVEQNLFKASFNVELDKINGYLFQGNRLK